MSEPAGPRPRRERGPDDDLIEFDDVRAAGPVRQGTVAAAREVAPAGRSRAVIAVVAVVAVVVVAIGLLTRDRDGRGGHSAAPTSSPTVTLGPTSTTPPSTSDIRADDVDATVLRMDGSGRQVRAFEPRLVGEMPDLVAVTEGKDPIWTEWWVEVPSELAEMTPVELLLIDLGALHRVALPSGRVHSVAIGTDRTTPPTVAWLGDNGVVYSSLGKLFVLIDGRIASTVEVGTYAELVAHPSGVIIRWWPDDGDGQRMLIVAEDGTVSELERVAGRSTWLAGVNRDGEFVMTGAGGTYAVLPDGGAARRLSEGDLLALGTSHALIQRCDEVLRCWPEVVDTVSGEARPADLGQAAPGSLQVVPRFLSPDGTKLFAFGPTVDAVWRVLDLTSGASMSILGEYWPIGQSGTDGMWLPGSDGLVMGTDSGFVVVGLDGTVTPVVGFDDGFHDLRIAPA